MENHVAMAWIDWKYWEQIMVYDWIEENCKKMKYMSLLKYKEYVGIFNVIVIRDIILQY